jgi:hypothetical protein
MAEEKETIFPLLDEGQECLAILCGNHHGRYIRKRIDYHISATSRQDSNKLDTFSGREGNSQPPLMAVFSDSQEVSGAFRLADG